MQTIWLMRTQARIGSQMGILDAIMLKFLWSQELLSSKFACPVFICLFWFIIHELLDVPTLNKELIYNNNKKNYHYSLLLFFFTYNVCYIVSDARED